MQIAAFFTLVPVLICINNPGAQVKLNVPKNTTRLENRENEHPSITWKQLWYKPRKGLSSQSLSNAGSEPYQLPPFSLSRSLSLVSLFFFFTIQSPRSLKTALAQKETCSATIFTLASASQRHHCYPTSFSRLPGPAYDNTKPASMRHWSLSRIMYREYSKELIYLQI